MFAYCNNNPVNYTDPTGTVAISIPTLIFIVAVVAGGAAGGYTAYKEYQAGFDTWQIIGDSLCTALATYGIVYTAGMSFFESYQRLCYLKGLTPVTHIGSTPNPAPQPTYTHTPQSQGNPLKDITYTEKVQQQKLLNDRHSFPDIVDNYGDMGIQQTFVGGDGSIYTKLLIPGYYKGHDGTFEYIWDANKICNHRFFEVSCK